MGAKVWSDHLFPGTGVATVQARDGPVHGEMGEAGDALPDGGEVDMGQAGQMAVVEADDGDGAGDGNAAAEEDNEDTGRAAVVEGEDRSGARVGSGENLGGLGALCLG